MAYKFRIKVSEDQLWGDLEPRAEGYDGQASGVKFAEMLCNAIVDEYPDAEVNVAYGAEAGGTDIYPDTEDEVIRGDAIRDDLNRITDKVWNSYPWEVELGD